LLDFLFNLFQMCCTSCLNIGGLSPYYIAGYIGKRLMSFEKIVDGAREWLDEYTYWPDGKALLHRRMTKEDGSVVEQDFDRRGRIIKE
jgi:hypothetical protein